MIAKSAVRMIMLVTALASVIIFGLIILSLFRDALTFMINIEWASVDEADGSLGGASLTSRR